MILPSGIIKFEKGSLPVEEIKYLSKVLKKSKVGVIDVFYRENESMYICCESYEVNMVAMYRIDLTEKKERGSFFVESNSPTDFDISDFDIFSDDSDIALDEYDTESIKASPMLKFSTLDSFLDCIIISKECEIVVDEDVLIRSEVSQFKLPRLKPMDLDKHIDMMSIDDMASKWEKVNVKNIKLIANVVSRTKKHISDMYIAVEGNSIYSDNKDVIFETSSWNVKNNYTFNYTMIEALRALPDEHEVKVAKHDKKVMLKVGDIYLGWGEEVEMESDNIMSFLDISKFQNIMMIPKKEFYKFRVMENFSKLSKENLKIRVLESRVIQLIRGQNLMHILGEGVSGHLIEICDSEIFLQLLNACGSDNPVISIDKSMEDHPTVLIEGQINILTSIESFTID